MRKILLYARREYLAAVRTKGFIIGLIIAPVLMSGGFIAFLLLRDRVDVSDKRMAVVDHSGVVVESLIAAAEYRNSHELLDQQTGKKIKPAYYFEKVEPDPLDTGKQLLELSDRVRRDELYAFVIIGTKVVHPEADSKEIAVGFYARNAALDDIREWITWPINDRLRKVRMQEAGIKEDAVADLFHWTNVEGLNLVSVDVSTGTIEDARKASPVEALLVPIAFMMIMFLMIMMSVPGMLTSVMEEKTQRIAEVLLGSITSFEFMMAKLLAGVAVSLTSSAVYIIGGFMAVTYMGFETYLPYYILPWFFIYLLLAIVMFGSMSAALGSTCSEAKDAQSLNFPAILPAIIPMFIYFPIAKEPLSSFATWMSLIPPFTPMLMVLRLGTPANIPAWQPYAGLAGVLLCTLFFVWTGSRIFRIAILMQGTPPKLSNIVRWALKG
jgi:ABC-2 type transport system permease protein